MAIPQFSKLVPGVRFSLPAPIKIKRPSGAFYFYREGNRVVFQKYELLHVFENPDSGGEATLAPMARGASEEEDSPYAVPFCLKRSEATKRNPARRQPSRGSNKQKTPFRVFFVLGAIPDPFSSLQTLLC